MGEMEWPVGQGYTPNVDAMARGLEHGNITLGLIIPGAEYSGIKPFATSGNVTAMLNHPALASKEDISQD